MMKPSLLMMIMTVTVSGFEILEHPEDVTVLSGEPASLQCRASGEVTWYKDGLRMRTEDRRDIVSLPDGSLFFLTTSETDTGLYHCGSEDSGVFSFPAALIVGTAEEGIIPSDNHHDSTSNSNYNDNHDDSDDDISDISIQIQDIPAEDVNTEILPLETAESQDLPNSIYIISMAVVAVLTIVIIIGAALIFNKIKKVNSGAPRDLESSAPMMYSVPRSLDQSEGRMAGDQPMRGKRGFLQYPHNHYNYILHTEYDAPMNLPQSDIYKCVSNSLEKKSGSPTNSYHYASSNIIQENSRNNQNIIHNSNMARSGTNYSVNKQAFNSPKDNFNYFSC